MAAVSDERYPRLAAVNAPTRDARPTPPHSEEAEQSVLGAIFWDSGVFPGVAELVGTQSFYRHEHQATFAAMQTMYGACEPIDPITVFDYMRRHGMEEESGGLPYLNSLQQSTPSARNVRRYAELVAKYYAERQMLAALDQAQSIGADALTPLGDRIERIAGVLDKVKALETHKPKIPVQWAHELGDEVQIAPQRIENLITAGGLSAWTGVSNSGKSFLLGHVALAVESGEPFLGQRRTKPGPVVYVAAEGASTMRARAQAAARVSGRQPQKLALVSGALNLMDGSADIAALIDAVGHVGRACGEPVALIVIDTLARVMAGGDENSAQDMGRLIAGLDRIKDATGAHVAVVHHLGKDASRGARGHSSLKAALDTEVEVSVDEATKTHYAKVTKQRDLPSKGETFAFKLVPVELGVDEWGCPVTSCVVTPSEVGIGTPAPRKLTASQLAVMGYLAGQERGVRRAQVVAALEPQGVSKTRAYAAMKELQIAGLVTELQGLLYMPKESTE